MKCIHLRPLKVLFHVHHFLLECVTMWPDWRFWTTEPSSDVAFHFCIFVERLLHIVVVVVFFDMSSDNARWIHEDDDTNIHSLKRRQPSICWHSIIIGAQPVLWNGSVLSFGCPRKTRSFEWWMRLGLEGMWLNNLSEMRLIIIQWEWQKALQLLFWHCVHYYVELNPEADGCRPETERASVRKYISAEAEWPSGSRW